MSITPKEQKLVHKLASGKGNAYDWLELKHSLLRTGIKVREHDKRAADPSPRGGKGAGRSGRTLAQGQMAGLAAPSEHQQQHPTQRIERTQK